MNCKHLSALTGKEQIPTIEELTSLSPSEARLRIEEVILAASEAKTTVIQESYSYGMMAVQSGILSSDEFEQIGYDHGMGTVYKQEKAERTKRVEQYDELTDKWPAETAHPIISFGRLNGTEPAAAIHTEILTGAPTTQLFSTNCLVQLKQLARRLNPSAALKAYTLSRLKEVLAGKGDALSTQSWPRYGYLASANGLVTDVLKEEQAKVQGNDKASKQQRAKYCASVHGKKQFTPEAVAFSSQLITQVADEELNGYSTDAQIDHATWEIKVTWARQDHPSVEISVNNTLPGSPEETAMINSPISEVSTPQPTPQSSPQPSPKRPRPTQQRSPMQSPKKRRWLPKTWEKDSRAWTIEENDFRATACVATTASDERMLIVREENSKKAQQLRPELVRWILENANELQTSIAGNSRDSGRITELDDDDDTLGNE